MEEFVDKTFDKIKEIHNRFFAQSKDILIKIASEISTILVGGGKVLLLGNGGSAADAQHIAAEFINRFKMDRPPLPAIALTTDSSVLTSISNDYSFDDIFEKQLMAIASPNDLVWAISTSGNSKNILKALRYATKHNIKTIGFTGGVGGKMQGLCDYIVNTPSSDTPRIQEVHILAAHIICELIDEILFGQFKK